MAELVRTTLDLGTLQSVLQRLDSPEPADWAVCDALESGVVLRLEGDGNGHVTVAVIGRDS